MHMNCALGMEEGLLKPKRRKVTYVPMFSKAGNITLNMKGKKEHAQIRGLENIQGSFLLACGIST